MNSATWGAAQAALTIDLDAIKANWRSLADRVAPAECAAVVKADAYGTGIERTVPALARAGCRIFFVAHLSEGARARAALRDAGWADGDVKVLLLHGLQPGSVIHPIMMADRLGPVLASLDDLAAWCRDTADVTDRPASIIQIDTGMNRIGLDPRETLPEHLLATSGAGWLMSHFVAAEEPDNPINAAQIAAFEQIRSTLAPGLPTSLCNSSGIFLPQRPHDDLVRPGYALYGGNPCPGRSNPMCAVVTLEAAILQLRTIEAGVRVGYNGRWVAERPTRLATIGVGYADGVPRGARTVGSGDGPVALLGGVPCPLVGRISMDLSIIDVTDASGMAKPGASVELIGPSISVDAFGAACNTIGYEILTNLGHRYGRTYIETTA